MRYSEVFDELRVVRRMLGEYEVFDRLVSCKEFVRRNVRYLIELRVVRSLLGEMRGIRLVESCKENVRECKVSD